jgi:hypothetical protein
MVVLSLLSTSLTRNHLFSPGYGRDSNIEVSVQKNCDLALGSFIFSFSAFALQVFHFSALSYEEVDGREESEKEGGESHLCVLLTQTFSLMIPTYKCGYEIVLYNNNIISQCCSPITFFTKKVLKIL